MLIYDIGTIVACITLYIITGYGCAALNAQTLGNVDEAAANGKIALAPILIATLILFIRYILIGLIRMQATVARRRAAQGAFSNLA